MKITEESIELSVERAFNRIDRKLMTDPNYDQEQYDQDAKRIREWADKEYYCIGL